MKKEDYEKPIVSIVPLEEKDIVTLSMNDGSSFDAGDENYDWWSH